MKNPQCLLYSAAMVLGVDPSKITDYLGHAGMEKVGHDLPSPHCYRGIHMQEICDFAGTRGAHFHLVQAMPTLSPKGSSVVTRVFQDVEDRFERLVVGQLSIVIGENKLGQGHAVAYNGQMILDPNGTTYPLFDFSIKEAWVLI